MSPLLELDGVNAGYEGPDVVHDVSLTVEPGEVVALLGPNGAGKTTILNAISGLARVRAGTVAFDGVPVHRLPPHRIATAGIAHVPQGRQLFGYSTGRENLAIGGYPRSDRKAVEADVEGFLGRWPIAERVAAQRGNLMSGGEQQVVAVGRGLMARPRLLLLDEPSLGLAPILVDRLMEMLRSVEAESATDGLAMLLVEQNAAKAIELANRVYVMVAGRVVHHSRASEITPAQVVELYLGR
ncbi:MAG TPA: ABC transporter ATP-binding protein [Thermoleophilaceae bacterium]|nr:ABC transporter ATP-binding protein [Thermoleophilaceae bacterium]